jgi:hypothetical protein
MISDEGSNLGGFLPPQMSGKEYLESVERGVQALWAHEVHIAAAARILGVDIVTVLPPTKTQPAAWQRFAAKESTSADAIYLYNRNNDHYEVVLGPRSSAQ